MHLIIVNILHLFHQCVKMRKYSGMEIVLNCLPLNVLVSYVYACNVKLIKI